MRLSDFFDKAVLTNSNYALAYFNLGRAYAILGENTKANKIFPTVSGFKFIDK